MEVKIDYYSKYMSLSWLYKVMNGEPLLKAILDNADRHFSSH